MSAVTSTTAGTPMNSQLKAQSTAIGAQAGLGSFLGGSRLGTDRYGGQSWTAGDAHVTDDGTLVFQNELLDLFHKKIKLKLSDVFAGKYGREIKVDFTNRETANVSDLIGIGPFRLDVPIPFNVYNSGRVRQNLIRFDYDHSMDVRGSFRVMGNWTVPFHYAADTVPEGGARYRFDLRYLRLGNSEFQVPDWLATMLIKMGMDWQFGRMDGIRRAGGRSLEVDFAHLYSGRR